MWTNKKGAIFDLDGTLVDSMWIWEDIDIEYLKRFGLEMPVGLQEIIEGMSMEQTAVYFQKRFAIEDSIEKIKEDWIKMTLELYRTRVRLKKDAARLLLRMKKMGVKLGIATSNSIELTMACLSTNKVEKFFDTIRTCSEVPLGKPAPDVYLSVAAEWNLPPNEIIVFEDVPNGALSGKRAGMEVCAVEDKYVYRTGRSARLREIADYYIKDFGELLL